MSGDSASPFNAEYVGRRNMRPADENTITFPLEAIGCQPFWTALVMMATISSIIFISPQVPTPLSRS